MKKLHIYTDGGARGNPGPAGAGIVLYDAENAKTPLLEKSIFLGSHLTNNIAEYTALFQALILSLTFNPSEVVCFLDSELVVKQLNGEYKVKNKELAKQYREICAFRSKIPVLKFIHIPREKNKRADALVNEILDKHEKQTYGIT